MWDILISVVYVEYKCGCNSGDLKHGRKEHRAPFNGFLRHLWQLSGHCERLITMNGMFGGVYLTGRWGWGSEVMFHFSEIHARTEKKRKGVQTTQFDENCSCCRKTCTPPAPPNNPCLFDSKSLHCRVGFISERSPGR